MNNASTPSPDAAPAIVVGVDGTSTALRAVEWAAAEARLRQVALTILHAAPYTTGSVSDIDRQRAHEILARAYTVAHRAEPGVPAATSTSTEQPLSALLAASRSAGLLVVGMGDPDRTGDLVIGSTALSASARAGCPVIVTRGRRQAPATHRPVLVGVDSVQSDEAALDFAFADARRYGGPLVVLHARHGIGQLHDRVAGAEQAAQYLDRNQLAEALAPWTRAYPDVSAELIVVPGHPSAALLDSAAHARLLVVGSRGRSAPARALFGSTSRELLRRCPTAVAVLPPGVSVKPLPGSADPDSAVVTGDVIEHPHDPSRPW